MTDQRIAFDAFVLDSRRGSLLRDGKTVAVGQRGLALLQALLEAAGQVVPKAELMERAWPGTFVEEGNLTVQIAGLRRSLGEGPDGQPWIVTVPRVGYRFLLARAEPHGAEKTHPGQPALAVAVLPFANLGDDPGQEYFTDGVVEDIITALSRFHSFGVIARNSSFAYKGRPSDVRLVARELGVRYVLEGSIRRAGDRLRITAQLVAGETGTQLWAEHFDGAMEDVFDFQDRITERVAMEVEPQIDRAEVARSRLERPGSIAAYDVYLQALAKISNKTAGDISRAYEQLTEALALEPDNALLLAYAAYALHVGIIMGWPPSGPDDRQKCAELARRGLQHAAGNPTVMAHCGISLLQAAREYDWGMAVLQSAAEANPNSLLVAVDAGIAHLHCGSIEDALAWFHRALRLSPRDPFAFVPLTGIAHAQIVLGNYPEALAWATRALALHPTFDCALWMLIAANAHLGSMGEARRFLYELRRIAPGVTVASIRAGQPAKDPSRVAAILDGLRLAGLPEDSRDDPAIPKLVVLPFVNLGADPGQDYLADGVVTEIIAALARYRSFVVVSPTSSFAYRGGAVDVRAAARELGVPYVLKGSLQRAGDRLRITAHLVDGVTGAHLWSEQLDGALADVFDFQDRITYKVATLVEPRITAAEIARSRRDRPGSLAAYDLYLQALAKVATETAVDNADALALLTDALALEPDNAVCLAHAAWALQKRSTACWPPIGLDDREWCTALARRGLENAAGDALVMARCGIALIHFAKDYDLGMAALKAAAVANPNDLMIVGTAGVGHLHCGDLDDALAHFHRANQLSPGDLGAYFSLCGVAHVQLILGDYAEALVWATRAFALNPNYGPTLWMLIAANAHLGRMAEAHRFLDDFRKIAPDSTVARIKAGQPAKDPGRISAILEGLRLAGLDEA